MPCGFAVQSATKEKNILPRRPDLRVDPPSPAVKRLPGVAGSPRQGARAPGLEQVPKKLLDFFAKDLLQRIDFERFLVDHLIPCDRQGIAQIVFWRLIGGNGARFHHNDHGEDLVKSTGSEHDSIQCDRKPVLAAAVRKNSRP
jgi:hypothetical protein